MLAVLLEDIITSLRGFVFALLKPFDTVDKEVIIGVMMPSVSEVCIPNIGLRERRKRLAIGIIQFVLCLVILTLLVGSGVDRWWRLVLFPMYTAAATGFFQWRDKT